MADTTLAQLESRLAVQLGDASNRIYSSDALEEAIRQALNEYTAEKGEAVTIKDLDAAAATTLPVLHEGLLLAGAGGFAMATRAIDRTDSFEEAAPPASLQSLATEQLKSFRKLLKEVLAEARRKDLRSAAVPPWSTTEGEQWLLPDEG
jgi:hypothetical protein